MNPFQPELRPIAALFRFFPPLELPRRLSKLRAVPPPPRLSEAAIFDRAIDAHDGRVPSRESTAPVPGLLWFHAGAYVMGSPEIHPRSDLEIVREWGITLGCPRRGTNQAASRALAHRAT
jgi:acetyl esterase/lipase